MAGVNVGTAYLEIIPSAKGFAGRLQRDVGGGMSAAGARAGTQAAEGFSSKFSSGVKSAAKAGAIGVAAGFAAVTGLGIAGAKMGLDIAAGNEQAQISFTTMLGSAQKAGSFLTDLQAFAAKTPFEFPELQTAASSLISAGINAKSVIPIMTTLGDVTSGMGTGSEGVQRATLALQQMSAAGKISGEDLNQLRDAGIPVYDLLSKATGKSKEEVVKLANAGKLGKKELGQMMTALETGKGLERFSGLMDKQSQSLTGLISTFKDTLGQGLANAIKPSIPLIKDGLAGASNVLAKVLPRIGDGLAGLTSLFLKGDFTKEFRKAFHVEEDSMFVGFLFGVRDAFKEVVGGVKAFGAAWKANDGDVTSSGFPGLMERIANALRKVQGLASDFWAGLTLKDPGSIGAPLEGFVAVGQKVRVEFLKLKPTFAAIWDSAKKLWPPIKEIATQLLAASQAGGVSTFGLLKTALAALPGILNAIAPLLQSVAKWMSENKTFVAALVVALTGGITAFKVITGIVKAFTIVQSLLNVVMAANPVGLVVIAIAALAAGLIYAYNNSETFRNAVDTGFKAIGAAGQWLWNSVLAPVIRWIIDGFANVVGGIADFLDTLSNIPGFGWAKDAADKMHGAANKARELATSIKDIPSEKDVKVVTTFTYPGYSAALSKQNDTKLERNGIRQFASGGRNIPAGMSLVGELGPELINVPGGSDIYTAAHTKAMMGAGSSAAIDYDRLAYAMSQVRVSAVVSPSALDRTMGARL